ncbi:MAG: hypothetical protein CVU60_02650 [Deltaproteobacteria bacterium HGW-Deltaproteobacteria-18]|nr:MAG: hypothetical protein CVU60_02650 [Deltaproteobacteria bacterium HGW-Deltaproteobacteria-18]
MPLLALTLICVSVSTVVFLHSLEKACCSEDCSPEPVTETAECADSVCGMISGFLSFLPEQAFPVTVSRTASRFDWQLVLAAPDPVLRAAEFPPEFI